MLERHTPTSFNERRTFKHVDMVTCITFELSVSGWHRKTIIRQGCTHLSFPFLGSIQGIGHEMVGMDGPERAFYPGDRNKSVSQLVSQSPSQGVQTMRCPYARCMLNGYVFWKECRRIDANARVDAGVGAGECGCESGRPAMTAECVRGWTDIGHDTKIQ